MQKVLPTVLQKVKGNFCLDIGKPCFDKYIFIVQFLCFDMQNERFIKLNESYSKNLSSSEDYLELIYRFTLQNKDFKAVDIAREMNISRASVSEALKKLSEKGYLQYEKYKKIKLTEKGISVAKEVLLKHTVLCSFFKDFLNLSDEESIINACRIEHVITPSAFFKIKNLVESL